MNNNNDEIRPPVIELGAMGWLRKNLFSNWFNSLLTIFGIYLLYIIGSRTPVRYILSQTHTREEPIQVAYVLPKGTAHNRVWCVCRVCCGLRLFCVSVTVCHVSELSRSTHPQSTVHR